MGRLEWHRCTIKKIWITGLILFTNISILFGKQKKNIKPIELKSPVLQVLISRGNGLPFQYIFKGSKIRGTPASSPFNAIVCSLKRHEYLTVPIKPFVVYSNPNQVDLIFKASVKGLPAATFHLKYFLESATLVITIEQVSEQKGFELIETAIPSLAGVWEEDGPGWMANAMDGGSVVNLRNAKSNRLSEDSNFGTIGYVLPAAIVGTATTECVMEVSAYMDGTLVNINGKAGHHHAEIGTVQTYRVHGGRAYEMNDGGPKVLGNSQTPNLMVGQMSRCRLDFLGDLDGNGSVDWLDGAKRIAKSMPLIPTKYFDDKFVYLVGGKYKLEKEPRTTFPQSAKLIQDIAMLTDYAPQLPLISGWANEGQDTGFPSEDSVNATLGGYQELMNLMNVGKKYNAHVSINTNYDDAYRSSPKFDTSFIARRPDGKLWKGRDWAGDTSYIIGMAKFMQNVGMQRIEHSIQRYGLTEAVLIDALSWFAIRNDWDPTRPESGYKNLVEGKYKIIEAFRRRGIEVASEQLRYPLIGKLAISADGSGDGYLPFGGEPIPFVATIYRKSAIWGAGGFKSDNVLKNLFWNCRPIPWFTNKTDRTIIADYYYLTALPYSKVHDLAIENYQHEGYQTKIGLESDCQIWIDWFNQDYSIKKDHVEIAGHNATFFQIDSNRIAFYARYQKELSAPLPVGWDPALVVARALFIDHREVVPVSIEKGIITVDVQAKIPVITYRSESNADNNR